MNDHSIRRYSMGWRNIVTKLEKRYKNIRKTDEEFTDELIYNALFVTKGSLHNDIKNFARELSLNKETLREKKSNYGTQRNPFAIGS